jgi:hypothetical protein
MKVTLMYCQELSREHQIIKIGSRQHEHTTFLLFDYYNNYDYNSITSILPAPTLVNPTTITTICETYTTTLPQLPS